MRPGAQCHWPPQPPESVRNLQQSSPCSTAHGLSWLLLSGAAAADCSASMQLLVRTKTARDTGLGRCRKLAALLLALYMLGQLGGCEEPTAITCALTQPPAARPDLFTTRRAMRGHTHKGIRSHMPRCSDGLKGASALCRAAPLETTWEPPRRTSRLPKLHARSGSPQPRGSPDLYHQASDPIPDAPTRL